MRVFCLQKGAKKGQKCCKMSLVHVRILYMIIIFT
nr:MAG TPA: hypothetical protein [Caudoviricetes sp.]